MFKRDWIEPISDSIHWALEVFVLEWHLLAFFREMLAVLPPGVSRLRLAAVDWERGVGLFTVFQVAIGVQTTARLLFVLCDVLCVMFCVCCVCVLCV